MNIAIFTNNYLPNPFGVSMSIESFRQEFEKAGHTVYIFAPKAKGYMDENPNVFRYPAIDWKFRNIRFPIAIPFPGSIDAILEKLEIDVIHSQHPNLLGWQARRWAKKKNVPLVFTWHTLYDQYVHFSPTLIPRRIALWWVIRNARKYADEADQVVVPTESVRKIIVDWGVKNPNIKVIPTGINEKIFERSDGQSVREKYGIKKDETLLVYIARFTKEKNVEFLFRAVVGILQKRRDVKFLTGGEGNLIEDLRRYVKEKGIDSQVIFAGFLSTEEKKNYYSAGDVFVFASKSETQGMVISEAMYSGLPIVAVRASGAQDQVISGGSGILVEENEEDFSQAVIELIDNADLRKRFSENAKKIALENYTSAICAGKMLETYHKAIEAKG